MPRPGAFDVLLRCFSRAVPPATGCRHSKSLQPALLRSPARSCDTCSPATPAFALDPLLAWYVDHPAGACCQLLSNKAQNRFRRPVATTVQEKADHIGIVATIVGTPITALMVRAVCVLPGLAAAHSCMMAAGLLVPAHQRHSCPACEEPARPPNSASYALHPLLCLRRPRSMGTCPPP